MSSKYFSLILLILLIVGCTSTSDKNQSEVNQIPILTQNLSVGTYTGEGSNGIYKIALDLKDGSMTELGLLAELGNPSYQAMTNSGEFMVSVSEFDPGYAVSFRRDSVTDSLTQLSKELTQAKNPAYITVNRKGNLVAVANYNGALLSVYSLIDGELTNLQTFAHSGSGPNTNRQSDPHLHFVEFYDEDQYLLVADLGIDEIKSYPVSGTGQVDEGKTAFKLEPGDGPRHLAFHPTEPIVFVINELSNTVVSLAWDSATATFSQIDRKGTLPEDFTGHNQCADIHLSEDGKFLYASNRGHNSIAIFEVSKSGMLTFLATESVNGDWPRNFILVGEDKYLLVANQQSNNVVSFSRNAATGLLTATGHALSISKPVCLKVY